MVENILDRIVEKYKNCDFIKIIVLGGSRATGTENKNSDIDIGLYYDPKKIDYKKLNEIAKELDDDKRDNLICKEGEWGKWVNFGGWLKISGYQVDLIFRDIERVKNIIEKSEKGEFSCNYQTGHPHSFLDIMYRGELASSIVLYYQEKNFMDLKLKAEKYPKDLKKALIDFFGFEFNFSNMFVEKRLESKDNYYIIGHIFRGISGINQVIFALNEKWLLNEKKAVFRVETFHIKPKNYSQKIDEILKNIVTFPEQSSKKFKELCEEVNELISQNIG